LVGCSPITRGRKFRGGVFFCGALHAGLGGFFRKQRWCWK
jgi:hypothetical protein